MKYVVAAIFAVILFAHHATAATVSGYAYDFYSLEPAKNVVVTVNTTPPQTVVAKEGFYSLELRQGRYLITAKVYSRGNVTHETSETINVGSDDGKYSLDLLLEPVGEFDFDLPDVDDGGTGTPTPFPNLGTGGNDFLPAVLALVVFAIAAGAALLLYRKRKRRNEHRHDEPEKKTGHHEQNGEQGKKSENHKHATQTSDVKLENASPATEDAKLATDDSTPNTADEEQVLDLLRKSEGRMQQRELRRILKWSEAKLSNVTDDLEEKGRIRKIKHGRGNILRLS